MGKKFKSLSKLEDNQEWDFQSKYSGNLIRQVFLSYDKSVDDQVRVIIQTNETSSIEILQFSNEEKLYSRTWCPQENKIEEEFDFMQISSCLYTKDYVCIGFSNGSVRLYSFPKAKLSGGEELIKENEDKINDHYYNTMFGDSQEMEEDNESTRFWLDDPSLNSLTSRLLMKHMGYPICIKERNGTIYVLYDDGALMSTSVESSMGYNVIRYDKSFQSGINFSLNPQGDRIAVSTSNRKLIVSSLEVKELDKKSDDGIRSCKHLFESHVFKKSLFKNGKKPKDPYNCLVLEWSSCGEYIYLPGDSEIRVIPVNEDPREIKYFNLETDKMSFGLDICIIKEMEYNKDERILVSLSLQGELKVYLLGLGMSDIREINTLMLNVKSMKESFPISMDLLLIKSENLSNKEVEEKERDLLYISTVLSSGELILNKLQLDLKTFNRVNLVKNKSITQNNEVLAGKLSKSKRFDEEYDEKNIGNNLLWDDVEVMVEEEEDNRKMIDSSKGGKVSKKKTGIDYGEDRNIKRRSGLRRLEDEEEMSENSIFKDTDELEDYMDYGDEDIISSGDRRQNGMDSLKGEMEDNSLDFEEEEEDEYEYESWDKREFGRHIEHLKGRIEKLKSIINNDNESQPPVHPGYTGDNEMLDSLNEENREFLYCWNQSGYVSYSIDEEGRPSIDMECYNSMDGPKKLRVYDTKGYNMACIGMDGYLLGRKSKVLDNGTIVSSIIDYNIWRTWGRSDKSGWSKTLLNGEDLVSMTCNRDFVAVITSLRYLRIWRNSGISVSVTKLVGSPVCCVSNGSYLLVVTQREPFYTPRNKLRLAGNIRDGIISGRCNAYEILFLDVTQETLIYNDIMSISPETIINWCGISNKGVPIIKDTSGQTFMLSRQWKNQKENWIPITNFGLLESSTSCKYFILGVNEDHFNVLKLPDGLDHPIPIMAKNNSSQNYSTIKIPFNIPILGLPSITQWMNIIENDPTLNECITNNNISWEIIDELRMKLDLIQGNISMVDEFSCHKDSNQYRQYKLQREKLLMRLYMKLVIKQLVEPAFDVVRMFNFPKSFQIALEQAEKSGERILANKISQEIQMRSKYEQEKSNTNFKVDNRREFRNLIDDDDNLRQTTIKNKPNIENINLNDERSRILASNNTSSSPSTSTPTSVTGVTLSSSTSASPPSQSLKMNNPFNIRTKSGDDGSSLNNLSGEIDYGAQHNEITQTIQYCSEIIKKRKV